MLVSGCSRLANKNRLLPFLNLDLNVASKGFHDSKFGLGNIFFIEPIVLGWHFDRRDVAAAAGVWCPTGNFNSTNPIHIGKRFWTGPFTSDASYYFDDEKTWHLSMLGAIRNQLPQDRHRYPSWRRFSYQVGTGQVFCPRLVGWHFSLHTLANHQRQRCGSHLRQSP